MTTSAHSPTYQTITVDSTLADCEVINMRDARGGRIIIPTGSSITSIVFYEYFQDTGTFLPCFDDTLTTPLAIQLTGVAGGKTYPIPAKLFASKYLKLKGDADGTVYVLLKG